MSPMRGNSPMRKCLHHEQGDRALQIKDLRPSGSVGEFFGQRSKLPFADLNVKGLGSASEALGRRVGGGAQVGPSWPSRVSHGPHRSRKRFPRG